ncbi:hypothetical protein LTR95_018851, partial [Oleoguttula sp. CCFEE 5521]
RVQRGDEPLGFTSQVRAFEVFVRVRIFRGGEVLGMRLTTQARATTHAKRRHL